MSNHLHLVVSAKNENLGDILKDFKKFTSTQIIEAIINNKQESRKDRMLRIFKEEGTKNLFKMRQAKKSYLDTLVPLPSYHSDN